MKPNAHELAEVTGRPIRTIGDVTAAAEQKLRAEGAGHRLRQPRPGWQLSSWTATAPCTDVPQQSLLSTLLVPVMHFWRVTSAADANARLISLPRRCGGARQQSNTKARCCLGFDDRIPSRSLRQTAMSPLSEPATP